MDCLCPLFLLKGGLKDVINWGLSFVTFDTFDTRDIRGDYSFFSDPVVFAGFQLVCLFVE